LEVPSHPKNDISVIVDVLPAAVETFKKNLVVAVSKILRIASLQKFYLLPLFGVLCLSPFAKSEWRMTRRGWGRGAGRRASESSVQNTKLSCWTKAFSCFWEGVRSGRRKFAVEWWLLLLSALRACLASLINHILKGPKRSSPPSFNH